MYTVATWASVLMVAFTAVAFFIRQDARDGSIRAVRPETIAWWLALTAAFSWLLERGPAVALSPFIAGILIAAVRRTSAGDR